MTAKDYEAAADTYEAEYLELCRRAGMESLRRECPECEGQGGFQWLCGPNDVDSCVCPSCKGLTWLPKPEAERMGALVRATSHIMRSIEIAFGAKVFYARLESVLFPKGDWHEGPTPEDALVEALLAATET